MCVCVRVCVCVCVSVSACVCARVSVCVSYEDITVSCRADPSRKASALMCVCVCVCVMKESRRQVCVLEGFLGKLPLSLERM